MVFVLDQTVWALPAFRFIAFWLLARNLVNRKQEESFELFWFHSGCNQLMRHRDLLSFVSFARYKLFRDEVALCSHASAIGIAS